MKTKGIKAVAKAKEITKTVSKIKKKKAFAKHTKTDAKAKKNKQISSYNDQNWC